MIIPIICLLLGALALVCTIPFWKGLFGTTPEGFTRLDLILYLLGYGLISAALLLGIIGYIGHFNGEYLRPIRIALGLVGAVVLGYQFVEMHARP